MFGQKPASVVLLALQKITKFADNIDGQIIIQTMVGN
jgi:hypothetical protein